MQGPESEWSEWVQCGAKDKELVYTFNMWKPWARFSDFVYSLHSKHDGVGQIWYPNSRYSSNPSKFGFPSFTKITNYLVQKKTSHFSIFFGGGWDMLRPMFSAVSRSQWDDPKSPKTRGLDSDGSKRLGPESDSRLGAFLHAGFGTWMDMEWYSHGMMGLWWDYDEIMDGIMISWDYIVIIPIGSMYGIYANIWGILMANVTIYGIHGSYGIYLIPIYSKNPKIWSGAGRFFDELSGETGTASAGTLPCDLERHCIQPLSKSKHLQFIATV